MSTRVLAAGIGNVFLGDDGFGVEVAGRLTAEPMPEGVYAADFGIRGMHLAYELLQGYDGVLLVDALPRGGEPGTLYVLEPDLDAVEPIGPETNGPAMDAHGMTPDAVLSLCKTLGGNIGRALVVGCEPADCSERMELSEPVAAAVDTAVAKVHELLTELVGTAHRVAG
ncbi:hydrogenase maturation protease [Haloactinomyces albus]|uniref:Hydrogenase maturation protease n=1 Tax=Haloactinomyces albus TaxID=1352928 RepID=A0AAE4CK79_9ACTN|nr:hydrogenase maturation protease [Haloactinomyces albus]MDR7300041.1 hydrogenase maturation protease [Haloactinomyces albus]